MTKSLEVSPSRVIERDDSSVRTLEAVALRFPDGSVEIISIWKLMAMPDVVRSNLRVRLAAMLGRAEEAYEARCVKCGGRVHISYAKKRGVSRPLFAHSEKSGARGCAWRDGAGVGVEELRRHQYDGQQESIEHRFWCEALATMARRDPRCGEAQVDSYWRGPNGEARRYPDVFARFEGLGAFVFEVQRSATWLKETAARVGDYAAAGVRLIYVVPRFDPTAPVPGYVDDIATLHRGCVFSLDDAALDLARERGVVALTAHVRNLDKSFAPPRVVTLDELTWPDGGVPFLEDRETPQLLARFEERRATWISFYERRAGDAAAMWTDIAPDGRALLDAFRASQRIEAGAGPADAALIDAAGVLLSVFAAAKGGQKILVTRYANIKALLNHCVTVRAHVGRCAALLELMLARSPLRGELTGSVGRHIARAKADPRWTQAGADDVEARLFDYLVPEVFDASLRALLIARDALPAWTAQGVDTPERACAHAREGGGDA